MNIIERHMADLTGISADPEQYTPRDFLGAAADTGQAMIVDRVRETDEMRKVHAEGGRLAAAIASAMRPDTQVGAIQPEEQVSPGVPLEPMTLPEPKETIQAGIAAVGKGGRKAVFSETPFDAEDLPSGYETYQSPQGGYYAAPKENMEEVVYRDSLNERHKVLGYPAPKPEGQPSTVVSARDDKGRLIQDVVTTPEGTQNYDMTIKQAADVAGSKGSVEVRTPEEAVKERTFDIYQHTMDEEHPEGYTSNFARLDDGTVGKAQANRDGMAHPYMFHVPGKGWEVDRGYGELIGKGLSEDAARKLVANTQPIPLEEAQAKVRAHLDKDMAKVSKDFKGLDRGRREALAMMLYQGGSGLDVSKWKAGNRIKVAMKTGKASDWKTAVDYILNSKWAAIQTPARALRVAQMLAPDTPMEELKRMLRKHQVSRGVVDEMKLAITETGDAEA